MRNVIRNVAKFTRIRARYCKSIQGGIRLNTYNPPKGTNYHIQDGNVDAVTLSRSLCKVVSYLQSDRPYVKLFRYADWWEHDGLHFKKAEIDFHSLFSIIESPWYLFENMPGDDYVFIGISPEDNKWYLRFYLDWDDNGEKLEGRFDVTIPNEMCNKFEQEVVSKFSYKVDIEDSGSYYNRIVL